MESSSPQSRSIRLLDRICRLCIVLAMCMLVAMSGLIVLQVAARNLLNLGLPWADELARFTGIALVYLAVPHLLLRDRHIAVDVFSGMLKGRWRRPSRLLNEVTTLAFAALTLLGFQQFLIRAANFSTPATGMPNLLFYMPALIGTALLLVVAAVRIAAILRNRLPEPDPASLP